MAKRNAKQKKGSANKVLVFLLVFFLFLVIFGGVCLWAVFEIAQDGQKEQDPSQSPAVSSLLYTEEDARNLLLISEDKNQAQGFVVVRIDPANVRVRTMALPRETEVDVGTQSIRLFELFAKEGVLETEKAIEKLLDIKFQNYVVISYDSMAQILTHLNNGVIFTLPETLDYTSDDGSYSISLFGGKTTLTASQVVDVLRYPNWHAGKNQEAQIQAEILAAVFNQYLVLSRNSQMDESFNFFIDRVTSDIKISHYNTMKEPLAYLAGKNTDASLCTVTRLAGEYIRSGADLAFVVDEEETAQLMTRFGKDQ